MRTLSASSRTKAGAGAHYTVTAKAGALYIDVAEELEACYKLQFHVNVEFGHLSTGSAACGDTKDASMARRVRDPKRGWPVKDNKC